MMIPKSAANMPPTNIARGNLIIGSVMVSLTIFEKIALEYAPMHIKPACPRLSSPRIPTVRLRDTARIE